MRFSTFLAEKEEKSNQHNNILILMHRIFSAVDKTHIDHSEKMSEFNIGQAVKEKNLKTLNVAVIKGSKLAAKFAVKKGSDDYYIIVRTPNFKPEMTPEEITNILENNKLKDSLHDAIKQFFKYAHDETNEKNTPTGHEEKADANQNVEKNYTKLIAEFKKTHDGYDKTSKEIDNQAKQTSNQFKQDSFKLARDKLKSETYGSNFKEFLSIINKLPEAKFITQLETEAKKKIMNRLQDFYEHYVSSKVK